MITIITTPPPPAWLMMKRIMMGQDGSKATRRQKVLVAWCQQEQGCHACSSFLQHHTHTIMIMCTANGVNFQMFSAGRCWRMLRRISQKQQAATYRSRAHRWVLGILLIPLLPSRWGQGAADAGGGGGGDGGGGRSRSRRMRSHMMRSCLLNEWW